LAAISIGRINDNFAIVAIAVSRSTSSCGGCGSSSCGGFARTCLTTIGIGGVNKNLTIAAIAVSRSTSGSSGGSSSGFA
jgi:hypothetical protein